MRVFTLLLLTLLLPWAAQSQNLPRVLGPGDEYWDRRFTNPTMGGLGIVDLALAVIELPNGDLIVGGQFQNAGGDPNADNIARWDGTAWHALGTGTNSAVYVLALAPNGDIYAGGSFQLAGGVTDTYQIARWDGTAWHALGRGAGALGLGVQIKVKALKFLPNGDLLVGGNFENAGLNPDADYIARWDGTAWQSFGAPLDRHSQIEAIDLAPNGDVVVGGIFEYLAGPAGYHYVARWDGTQWQNFLPELNNLVRRVKYAPNGDMFVGGLFTSAGGSPYANYVARYSGNAWHALDRGLSNRVLDMALNSNGDIIVGGSFFDAGGNTRINHIGRWDGTAWQSFGTGLSGPNFMEVLCVFAATNGDYAFGGDFTSAGDTSIHTVGFALYHPTPVGLPEASVSSAPLRAYPNPAHGTLQAQLPAQFSGPLTLLDATGRTIRTQNVMAGTTAAMVDLHGVAPGLYVLRAGAVRQRIVVE